MSAPQPPVPPESRPTPPPVPPWPHPAPPRPSSPIGRPTAPASPTAPARPAAPGPFAAPYVAPVHPGYGAALLSPPPRKTPVLGIVALVAGLAATVVTPIVAAVAAFRIGLGAGRSLAMRPIDADFDFGVLSPVRDWVLLGEIMFWVGTALGLWALVQGIIALVSNRGRVPAIVAVTAAVAGPIVFGLAVWIPLVSGLEAGSSIGG